MRSGHSLCHVIPKITWFKDGKAIGSGETLSLNVH